ncbi:MAG TPA: hypothetical protein VFM58_25210 [Solirubrobacteraceae bacterium]|jgi:hypothetical protein|nr:hypothetical protein [Solirubrobacteraceae bacterium]
MQSTRVGILRPFAALAAVALAVAFAACGSDSGDASASAPEPAATPVEVPSDSSAPAGSDDGVLPLGKRAVTDYIDYTGAEPKKSKLGVTVVKVRKGKISDLKDFDLDAKQKKTVPYYVDAKYENLGDRALTRSVIEPSIEDRAGDEYRPIQLIVLSGTFKPCPEYSDAKLKPGESFTGCSPVLLPKGKQFDRVRFEGDVTKDPLFWRPQ